MEALHSLSAHVTQNGTQMGQIFMHHQPLKIYQYTCSEPQVQVPGPYLRYLKKCWVFLLQCSLVFEQQPWMYHSDKSKITYITGLLNDNARDWGTALWGKPYVCFPLSLALSQKWGRSLTPPVQDKKAIKHLLTLCQGSHSIMEYAVEFRILAAASIWNDKVFQGVFLNGLSDQIKDELVTRDEPDNYDSLISKATWMDNHLWKYQRQRTTYAPQLTTFHPSYVLSTQTNPSPLSAFWVSPSPVMESTPGDEPMQLGQACFPPTECLIRLKTGEYFYCEQSFHPISTCPNQPKDRSHQEQLGPCSAKNPFLSFLNPTCSCCPPYALINCHCPC